MSYGVQLAAEVLAEYLTFNERSNWLGQGDGDRMGRE